MEIRCLKIFDVKFNIPELPLQRIEIICSPNNQIGSSMSGKMRKSTKGIRISREILNSGKNTMTIWIIQPIIIKSKNFAF